MIPRRPPLGAAAPFRNAAQPALRAAARLALVALVATAPLAGHASAQRSPGHEFAVDAEVLGGTVSYAWGGADGSYWGIGAGVGGSLLSTMVLAGRHFSEEGWIAYAPRDGFTDKLLIELLHAEVFRRWAPSTGQDYDVGVRASAFLHADSSDDDPGFGGFLGAYATAHWGWEHLKIGPRVLVGLFTEGSRTREFGVFVSPLTARVGFGW